jgi:cytochrome c oxidase subunit 2
VKGVATNGKKRYATCGACHGTDGRGIQAMNAPRLAGMSDWYMVTQLKNYQQGIRGAHPEDMYGNQMALMAAILADDQAINDLVSYANSLVMTDPLERRINQGVGKKMEERYPSSAKGN